MVLDDILNFIKNTFTKRPYFVNGNTLFLTPNHTETVSIEVPKDWSEGWTVKIQPTDKFFTQAKSDATARLLVRISASGGILTKQNEFLFDYNGTVFANGADPIRWMPSPICGECHHVKGNKVDVDLYFETSSVDTNQRPVIISICKGFPTEKRKTTFHTLQIGASGVSIPRNAKAFRLVVGNVAGVPGDLSQIQNTSFVTFTNSQLFSFAGYMSFLAEQITFDAAGGISSVGKSSNWIPIHERAAGISFGDAILTPPITLMIEWLIYE